ncbi:hypothetical protein Y032_0076g1009 [Ancylostoma ceylanicum]|uniref:Uncharacterized protein n=1 Tax=Ancylostoma ceylanicum TaxID=53326 RepID=A0A016TUM8_9BILA|nr:hypothetical protein Y032_0076g1009 [Ancylostoma ceylanicum]
MTSKKLRLCTVRGRIWLMASRALSSDVEEVSPDADDLEVLQLLNSRKSRQHGRVTPHELDVDDSSAVDMDLSRPSSSVVMPLHRTRNGHPPQEDFGMSDDDESYPINDQDDIECSDRSLLTRNNLPLIPTECGSVTEALHNFVVVFESRSLYEEKPLPEAPQ